MTGGKRILIVGGVAGGASCAARARRMSEEVEIILFDRGPHVSFANCGLPYYVGDVIKDEEKLLVATPDLFKKRFNIDVRLNSEILSIDREKSEIEIHELLTGRVYRESYDALVLSPGAAPIRPPLPGIDLPGIFTLRNIPDSQRIRQWLESRDRKRAVIVGGGFIGLEMAENLVRVGSQVAIVEMQPHVMPLLDPEMASGIHEELSKNGVSLRLGDAVTGFEEAAAGGISVKLASGGSVEADVVILSIGVRPEIKLARDAGLEIGELGGIRVNEGMRTSDKHIWAVGDAVEVKDVITGKWLLVPLAGPANRQGRIAADAILGRGARFRGSQGTAILGVFSLTVASTGLTEKALKRIGMWDEPFQCEKIYLYPGSHAMYYPGAAPISIKLIFSKKDGRVLGAQAIGTDGVDKRIDVLAMAIQKGATVFDLEEAELCYSPQYGSAKDPVNIAGMIAANILRGDSIITHWEEMPENADFVLDVRDPVEFKRGHIEGALNIPLNDLRERMRELPKDRKILTYCMVGQRSYFASRALIQYGFNAKNYSGGLRSFNSRLENDKKKGKKRGGK